MLNWSFSFDYVMLFTSLFLLAELFATLDTHSCISETWSHDTTILAILHSCLINQNEQTQQQYALLSSPFYSSLVFFPFKHEK